MSDLHLPGVDPSQRLLERVVTLEALASRTRMASQDFGLVTALPSPAKAGDYCTYTNSLTSPAYAWRLQYNPSEAGSFKWVFIGGSPVTAFNATASGTFSFTTYAEAANNPSVITLPLGGDYDAHHHCLAQAPTVAGFIYQAVSVNNSSTVDAQSEGYTYSGGTGADWTIEGWSRITGRAASDTLRLMQKVLTGNGNVDQRSLRVTPVRVG